MQTCNRLALFPSTCDEHRICEKRLLVPKFLFINWYLPAIVAFDALSNNSPDEVAAKVAPWQSHEVVCLEVVAFFKPLDIDRIVITIFI